MVTRDLRGACPSDEGPWRLRHPALQWLVLGDPGEVRVGGEQRKLVPDTELGQDGVAGADLYAAATRAVAELCRAELVVTVGCQEGKCGEALDDRSRL